MCVMTLSVSINCTGCVVLTILCLLASWNVENNYVHVKMCESICVHIGLWEYM